MPYLVVYSRGPLPKEPLAPNDTSQTPKVHQAGPFHGEQDAIREACRIYRDMPEYSLEIWHDGERVTDTDGIRRMCR